jgi:hypothetical protein
LKRSHNSLMIPGFLPVKEMAGAMKVAEKLIHRVRLASDASSARLFFPIRMILVRRTTSLPHSAPIKPRRLLQSLITSSAS